jgi:hypothetical protein
MQGLAEPEEATLNRSREAGASDCFAAANLGSRMP